MNVTSVCFSIISMLASATEKLKPDNNEDYVRRAKGKSPQDFIWTYHDDNC